MSLAENIYNDYYNCEWKEMRKLEMSISNNTMSPQYINLFSYSIQNVVSEYPLLQFSDPLSYDILVQDLEYSPIKIREILVASKSQTQLANSFQIKKKYADGTENLYNEFPIISIDSQFQVQGNRVEVLFEELILDSFTSFSNYKIDAGETVTILLYYRQLKRICVKDFPNLFPKQKRLTDSIKNDISKRIKERDTEFIEQDVDWVCKKGKKIFEVQITNNTTTQQFVNLFDTYSLTNVQDIYPPSNTLTLNSGLGSSNEFIEWVGNGKGYTINTVSQDIINYDDLANPVSEYNFGFSIRSWTLSNYTNKMYISASNILYSYDLGSGNVPVGYLQSQTMSQPIVDNKNGFLFVFTLLTSDIIRLNLSDLSISTTIPLGSVPFSKKGVYFPDIDKLVLKLSNDLITMNPISGVISIVDNFVGDISSIIYLDSWGSIAISYAIGVNNFIRVYDSLFNVLGVFNGGSNFIGSLAFDSDRHELISTFSDINKTILFFTLDSIQDNTFSSSFITGITSSFIGYLSNSKTVLMGDKIVNPVQSLSRESTVTFSNPDSYNFFTRQLDNDPVKVACMDVIANSNTQLVNNLVIQNKDANGMLASKTKSPITRVDVFQNQSGRANLKFDKLILNGNETFTSYPLNGGETVSFILYYHQFKRASLLSGTTKDRIKIKLGKPIDYSELDRILNFDKHECNKNSKKIEITVTNTTNTDSYFKFFRANTTQLVINQPDREFDNVDDYNFLITQLRNTPLSLCGIELKGNTQRQLKSPLIVNTKNANGRRFNYYIFPLNHIDVNQKNGNQVFFKTKNIFLDGDTNFPLYNIQAMSSITFILYYRQFLRSNFFDKQKYSVALNRKMIDNNF